MTIVMMIMITSKRGEYLKYGFYILSIILIKKIGFFLYLVTKVSFFVVGLFFFFTN